MDIQRLTIDTEILARDWLEIWMNDTVRPRLALSTIERYSDVINRQLAPNLDQIKLSELSAWHVRNINQQLMQTGISAKTIALINTVLSGACKYALHMGRINYNPVNSVPTPPNQRNRSPDS